MNALGSSTPVWFRVVAVIAVLWNLLGVYQYLAHVGAVPPMQPLTPEQQAMAATVPAWVVGAFAIAVFSALLASILMLVGKALSRPLFLLSLICVIAQSGWVLLISDARRVEGNAAFIMPIVITGIGLLFYWISNTGVRRGWLR